MLLHMVLDNKTMTSFNALKGKRATVTGTLFHSLRADDCKGV
jgi:hypothetical protein